jgi:Tfp pilus assembly protein PilN
MIKVNLIGAARKQKAKKGIKIPIPKGGTNIVLLLIALGSVAYGYWWYTSVTGESARLSSEIMAAEAQKAQLEAVIAQNQVYESRKKALENRVRVIENLQRNQVSPVVALDILSQAIDRTQYVWLNSLDQNNTVLTMSGLSTSLLALADFYSSLQATGYFKNIDVSNAQDSSGNFTFALKCEFSPPPLPPQAPVAPAAEPAPTGGN